MLSTYYTHLLMQLYGFSSKTKNLHTIIWFQVFQAIISFQVNNKNNNPL